MFGRWFESWEWEVSMIGCEEPAQTTADAVFIGLGGRAVSRGASWVLWRRVWCSTPLQRLLLMPPKRGDRSKSTPTSYPQGLARWPDCPWPRHRGCRRSHHPILLFHHHLTRKPMKVAVVGSGASGLAATWVSELTFLPRCTPILTTSLLTAPQRAQRSRSPPLRSRR